MVDEMKTSVMMTSKLGSRKKKVSEKKNAVVILCFFSFLIIEFLCGIR